MKKMYFFILLISTITLYGQSTISTAGNSMSSDILSVDYAIGQLAVTSIEGSENRLHQGVLQGLKIENLSKKETEKLAVSIWPTPVLNVFNISTQGSAISYQLYNAAQQKTSYKGYVPENSSVSIDIDELPATTYFLHLTNDRGESNILKVLKVN